MSKLGLNPDLIRSYSGSIESQLGLLASAQSAVISAGASALNPLNIVLSPGTLIMSPFSITQAALAATDIAAAQASARELVGKLLAEVEAQEFASSGEAQSYLTGQAWRTADANRVPDVQITDYFDPISTITGFVDDVATLYGYGETAFDAANLWAKKHADAFVKWWDDLPPWAGQLKKFSKYLPIVGAAATGVDFGIAIANNDWPGIIQNGGSLLIDGITTVIAPTGVGLIIGAAVGIVWDVGWEIGYNVAEVIENPTVMSDYYEEVPWMMPIHAIAPITYEIWGPLAD